MNPLSKTLTALAAVAVLGAAPLALTSTAQAAPAARSAATGHCARTLDSYPTLRPGARRPAVRTLQCALDDLGAHVTVDGYYGPQTRAAVQKIEDGFEGVPAHPGTIDSGFWTLLYGRQLPQHRLAQGARGHAVLVLQRALRAAGGDITVDGDFGAETTAVVKQYQQVVGVRPTGKLNQQTYFFLSMGAPFK